MSLLAIDTVVEAYVGIPYRHGGRDRTGLDCLGLVHSFYNAVDINVPDGDGEAYAPRWWVDDPTRYLRGILVHGSPVCGDLRPLDFVYFRMAGDAVTHGGIMVDAQRFIHVLEGRSVMVSRLASWWRRRFAGARRFS